MMLKEKKSRIYLSSPHMSGNEKKYINDAFDTNWIAPLGPNVDSFEQELASYVGTKGAAAVSSGTAAIHLALQILNVRRGDTVFCSSFTFIASANPILYLGAEPVFIDSDLDSWNMSTKALEKALIEAKKECRLPKAIIVVNLYGQSAKMDEILELCTQYDIPLIEDAAESLGSTYKGKMSGSFGNFGVYSFNGNKIITTSGGGMLVSDDEDKLKQARFLATQARDDAPYYLHSQLGHNYRMSNILAGIGRAQLEVLDARVKARRNIFNRYKEAFGLIEGIEFMPELDKTKSNRWLSTLTINPKILGITPMDIIRSLEKENIESRLLWKPLHTQPIFNGVKYYQDDENTSNSDYLFENGLCLPSGSNMKVEEQDRVIEIIESLIVK
jgi:pyridoxal phosphate-dependent aminotransferase EpsN